jgi:hypothetical protein
MPRTDTHQNESIESIKQQDDFRALVAAFVEKSVYFFYCLRETLFCKTYGNGIEYNNRANLHITIDLRYRYTSILAHSLALADTEQLQKVASINHCLSPCRRRKTKPTTCFLLF